jgi:hypothetical protein
MYTICGVACALLIIIVTGINIFLNIKIDKLRSTISEQESVLHDKEVNNTLLSQMCKQYEDGWLEEKEKSAELQKKLDDLPSSPKFEDPTVIHVNHLYPITLERTCEIFESDSEHISNDLIKDRLIDLMKPVLRKCLDIRDNKDYRRMMNVYHGRLKVILLEENIKYDE